MATIHLGGNPVRTQGVFPAPGHLAPNFTLIGTDLQPVSLADYRGKTVVLNIFPNVDTSVCDTSVCKFNQAAGERPGTHVLCISKDLPFAHKRFCEAEGLDHVVGLSDFRSPHFSSDYGILLEDGPLAGLTARAVVVVNDKCEVVHSEMVNEIGEEPNYEAALNAVIA
ncbi:MAG: thiol peroxidase [Flavobacteriales bacterium]